MSLLAFHWVYKHTLINLLAILAPPVLTVKITWNQHVQNEWTNAMKWANAMKLTS